MIESLELHWQRHGISTPRKLHFGPLGYCFPDPLFFAKKSLPEGDSIVSVVRSSPVLVIVFGYSPAKITMHITGLPEIEVRPSSV